MSTNETPHRRIEDHFVSYKDMVEYFAKQFSEFHQIRAEGLIHVSNQMERAEKVLTEFTKDLADKFEKHEQWHRDVLQGFLNRSSQNKIATTALIISSVGILLSTIIAIITLLQP
jgi:uncharacterized membrane protein